LPIRQRGEIPQVAVIGWELESEIELANRCFARRDPSIPDGLAIHSGNIWKMIIVKAGVSLRLRYTIDSGEFVQVGVNYHIKSS
jgi:hypothetical protein